LKPSYVEEPSCSILTLAYFSLQHYLTLSYGCRSVFIYPTVVQDPCKQRPVDVVHSCIIYA
jgi:hypothetical protein